MPKLPTHGEIILKVQSEVYPKRCRVVDFFRDYDNLRKYEVTQAQFVRALNLLMCSAAKLLPDEVNVLVEHYKRDNGLVEYKTFCDEIESVFTTANLHVTPNAVVPKAGSQIPENNLPHVDDEMSHILHRVALLLRTRGLVMKYIFEDLDRGDSASLVVPRRAGKVTESQFRRAFPFGAKDFSEYELTRIVERYKDENGNVNYKQLHEDVTDPADVIKEPPIPTSIFVPYEADKNRTWTSSQYNMLERVTAKVLEKRVRLSDYFLDFDPLRSGFIKATQVDTVFGICGLNKDFTFEDVKEIKAMYHKQDQNFALFNHAQFCEEVQKAFVYDKIHTDPLARTQLPTSDATMPARRSRVELSAEETLQCARIEEDVRSKVKKRRILFVNAFADFDRTGEGHVTVNQFARVMSTLKCAVDPAATAILCLRYCDKGDKNYFNYREFCRNCDPPSDELSLAETQNLAPYEKHQPDKYFDIKGRVYDKQF